MIDIGLAGALAGGVLSLLSPCSVMLLPAFFAYAFGSVRQILARTAIFYLGLVAGLVPLGVFAAALGGLVVTNRQSLISVVAVLIVLAGLTLLLGISVPLPGRSATAARPTEHQASALATFLLGTVYAVAGVCAGPILGSVLLVASLGSPLYGAALMAVYALGMCLPLVILAVLWGRLGAGAMTWLRPRSVQLTVGRFTWRNSWVSIVSGLLTVGVGILLLATDGTAELNGWLDVATQSAVETSALGVAAAIPDLWLVLLAVLTVVGVVLIANREPTDAAHG